MPGTALPNMHPAIVHFPIALLLVALGFDLACVVWRKHSWLDRGAATLFVLGAVGAWAAVLTGERAADSLVGVPAQVQPLIGEHHDWAQRTAWVFTIVALVRLAFAWVDRGVGKVQRVPIRLLLLAGVLAGQWMLVGTADRGGVLVYGHGLAVSPRTVAKPEASSRDEAETSREVAESPEARLVQTDEGGLRWTPHSEDAAALGTVLSLVDGSAPVGVSERASGLGLIAAGRSVLLLPGEFGDVEMEMTIEASAFQGTVGLVHHVGALDEAGGLGLSTGGHAALWVDSMGGRKVLDEAEVQVPHARFTLAVSAAGRHFKGMVDGGTVVHGHRDPSEPGGAGLLLDGEGVVRVHSLRVTPLEGH